MSLAGRIHRERPGAHVLIAARPTHAGVSAVSQDVPCVTVPFLGQHQGVMLGHPALPYWWSQPLPSWGDMWSPSSCPPAHSLLIPPLTPHLSTKPDRHSLSLVSHHVVHLYFCVTMDTTRCSGMIRPPPSGRLVQITVPWHGTRTL